jgi:CHASE3 domain sensor protein
MEPMGQWTLRRKLASGFAVAASTLLIVAVTGYQGSVRSAAELRWVTHTWQVKVAIAQVLSQVVDAETGQRGYVITGQDLFLEPYRVAVGQIDRSVEALESLVSDNPSQVARVRALRPVIRAKLEELAHTIELRGASPVAAVEEVASGRGKQALDAVRQRIAEMQAEEESLLAIRQEASDSADATSRALILWGSALGILLVSGVGAWISASVAAQIGQVVRDIQSSSAELQSAANQQAAGAREQATAMNQITITMAELLATSRQIADGARSVARISEEAADFAGGGVRTVDLGHESVAALRRQVDLIVHHMLELVKKSNQIGAVLDIVSELADQTSILSINASIEAAGASESGRRFGVVADEIRKLATRVSGSSKEIRELVEEVRRAVQTSVMATETGSKTVDANAKQFAEVAGTFERIRALVSNTMQATQEIQLSTQQQATASAQVSSAVSSVADVTRETETSTVQTFQTAAQLAQLSKGLLRIVQPQAA